MLGHGLRLLHGSCSIFFFFFTRPKSDKNWDHILYCTLITLSHPATGHGPTSHQTVSILLKLRRYCQVTFDAKTRRVNHVSLYLNNQL